MLDVAVSEATLPRPSIVPFVGKLVTATVAQHVGMDRKGHARTLEAAGCRPFGSPDLITDGLEPIEILALKVALRQREGFVR
jgi:hypothetical protein